MEVLAALLQAAQQTQQPPPQNIQQPQQVQQPPQQPIIQEPIIIPKNKVENEKIHNLTQADIALIDSMITNKIQMYIKPQ